MKKYIIYAITKYDFYVICREKRIPIYEAIHMDCYAINEQIRGRYKQIKNNEIKCIGISKKEVLTLYEQGRFCR